MAQQVKVFAVHTWQPVFYLQNPHNGLEGEKTAPQSCPLTSDTYTHPYTD